MKKKFSILFVIQWITFVIYIDIMSCFCIIPSKIKYREKALTVDLV